MSLQKLKNVYFLGSLIKNIKGIYDKTNEIIDYLNGTSGYGSYKVYTALLTQSGINEPSVIILNNTIGNISVSIYASGIIEFNCNSKLIINKRVIFLSNPSNLDYGDNYFQNYEDEGISNDYYRVVQKRMVDNNPANGFSNLQIEIRVYN